MAGDRFTCPLLNVKLSKRKMQGKDGVGAKDQVEHSSAFFDDV